MTRAGGLTSKTVRHVTGELGWLLPPHPWSLRGDLGPLPAWRLASEGVDMASCSWPRLRSHKASLPWLSPICPDSEGGSRDPPPRSKSPYKESVSLQPVLESAICHTPPRSLTHLHSQMTAPSRGSWETQRRLRRTPPSRPASPSWPALPPPASCFPAGQVSNTCLTTEWVLEKMTGTHLLCLFS